MIENGLWIEKDFYNNLLEEEKINSKSNFNFRTTKF